VSGFSAGKVIGFGAGAIAAAVTLMACGTSGRPREGAGAGAGGTGTGATGGTGANGGTGTTGGAGSTGATGGAGSSSVAGMAGGAGSSSTACNGVGNDALIATFDEGATIVERNYPIASGAMPGGTYAYADPMDTSMAFALSVVDGGHTCKALAMSITGSSFRGMGFWTSAAVDATSYAGISFWARRGAGSIDPTALVVSLGLDAVTAVSDAGGSGTCMAAAADCVRPQLTIAIGDTWTRYSLTWAMFTPGSAGGTAVPASGDRVNGLDFSFQLAGSSLETTVLEHDDVAFLTSAP